MNSARKTRYALFGFGLALGACALAWVFRAGYPPEALAPNDATPSPQNVVLVIIDTLRADRVTARRNGRRVMPSLDAFSKESWNFTNAVTQASWTKPAVVSVFTSLYPGVHNVQFAQAHDFFEKEGSANEITDILPESLETMAAYFKSHGYSTAAVQANVNLKDPSFGRGFDSYYYEPYPEHTGQRVTDHAIEVLKKLKSPFFLYVQYLDPHQPYDPPADHRDLFGSLPPLTSADEEVLKDFGPYYMDKILYDLGYLKERKWGNLSPSGIEHVRMLYDAEAHFADSEMARLVGHIRTRAAGRSVFVITADHGEELWDHGSVGHGKTLYEEVVHVPLMFSFPDLDSRRLSVPAETIDILPTLSAYLGLEPRPQWQGRNLLHEIEEPDFDRPLYTQTKTAQRRLNFYLASVRVGTKKIILDRMADRGKFFELGSNASETIDLSEGYPEGVTELRRLWDDHEAENRRHPNFRETSAVIEIDAGTKEELDALGYAGAPPPP